MNKKVLALPLLAMCLGLLGCGLPLVPDSQALADSRVTAGMTLMMECRLLEADPHLALPGLGPEPDNQPLLIPLPDPSPTKAFLMIPQVADASGTATLGVLADQSLGLEANEALVYGIQLDPASPEQSIPFASTLRQALAVAINLPPSQELRRRFDLNLYRQASDQAWHLLVSTSPDGAARSAIHAIDFPSTPLSPAAPGTPSSNTAMNLQSTARFQLDSWRYQPGSLSLNSNWPDGSDSPPFTTDSESIMFSLPLRDRILMLYRNSSDPSLPPADRLHLGLLAPWQNATTPQFIAFEGTPLGTLAASQISALLGNAAAGAFVSWNPNFFGGQLTLAHYAPDAQGSFRYYSLTKKNAAWSLIGPVATEYPPVRSLADGTLLSLRQGAWSRAAFGSDGHITTTSDGTSYATASLQFVYEFSDAAGWWMVFSQAIPVKGAPGKGGDLILRAWKILESDFLKTGKK